MSFTRRIIDGARSGLNSILDNVAADDTPLSHVSERELQVEVERRVAARGPTPDPKAPYANPAARWAGASEEARRERARAASAREARIRGDRQRRDQARTAAREEAFRQAQSQARASHAGRTSSSWSSSSSSSSSSSRRPGGFSFGRQDPKIAGYYKTLNLEYGAGFDEVKAAYRQLMRKYHPDLHGRTPQKQKAATELATRVTQAYNELDIHLNKKK